MKQFTFSAVMANNLLTVLQRYSQSLRLLLVMLLTLTASTAWGADGDIAYTLSCVKNTSNSAYATYYDVTINSKKWTALGNQTLGAYWRIGGKSLSNTIRNITGKNTIDKPIKKITISHNGKSNNNLTVNSFSVTVATDANFSNIIETKTITSPSVSSAGSFDLTPTNSVWESGCYYKFSIVLTNSKSSNYGLDLTSIVFYEGSVAPDCIAPTITTQPSAATYTKGATATALKVVASGDDLTYQWYSNTSNNTSGATKINGATNSTYTPSTSTVGTKYYYCIVSSGSCSTTSNIVSVVVKNPPFTVTLNAGPGTCAASVTEASAGKGVTLPTPTLDGCGNWEFAGWKTTSAVTTETTTEPTLIPAGDYKPTDNITLYAVYQRTETTGGGATPTTTSNVFSNGTFANSIITWTLSNVVSIKQERNGNSNSAVADYVNEPRWYKGHKITITPSVDITKITVVAQSGYADELAGATFTNATASYSDNTVTISPTNGIDPITIVMGAQARLSTLSVTYSGGGSSTTYYHSTPDCGAQQSYSVTYDVNGPTGYAPVDENDYNSGDKVTILNKSDGTNKQDYFFAGWATNPEGIGDVYQPGDEYTITDNTIFYAKWVACSETNTPNVTITNNNTSEVTISWNSIDGANEYRVYLLGIETETEIQEVISNTSKTITWGNDVPADTYMLEVTPYNGNQQLGCGGEAEIVLKAPTYTVTWMVNGVQYGEPQVDVAGTEINKPADPAEGICYGKVFVGWAENEIDGESKTEPADFHAKDDDLGKITGNVTYHAVFATQDGATETEWVKKEIGDIKGTDVVVITMTKSGTTYVLYNHQGTAGAPSAYALNIADGKITSDVSLVNKWNISNNDGNLTIYPNGTTEKWLYCTDNSNGVRVGTNENKIFTIDATYGYLKHTGTNRYVGVYNNQDWRCYTSMHDNIKGQTLGFYVKSVVGGSYSGYVTHCEVCTVTELTLTPSASEVNLGEAGNAVVTFTPTGGNGGAVSYVASPDDGVTWNNNEATFAKAGTYTITASQDMNDDKCPTEATTTVVVTATPVLYFWEEPADPIVFVGVECGGNKTTANKQSVSLRGYNLTGSVNVTVEGDYKIAKTAGESIVNYKTTLTLDNTGAGKIHLDYDDVYIIATPPAGSIEPTTGTLTFTTEGGNTLTVNLSTPTITCPQYTLTFNDRGTKATEQYYVGEVVDEPEEPTGVCTEPINYVFDGWATATVNEGSTTYEKVSFGSYTMPKQNTTLYAVYRYVEEGSGSTLTKMGGDDWELKDGDKIVIVAEGSNLGLYQQSSSNYVNYWTTSNNSGVPTVEEIQEDSKKYLDVSIGTATGTWKLGDATNGYLTNPSTTNLSFSTSTPSDWTLIAWNDDTYTLKATQYLSCRTDLTGDNKNKWRGAGASCNCETNSNCYGVIYYNLYKYENGTTYYTTSPVCGPHLEVTDGKEIYVTGGNAGGKRDLVIAQQTVSYKATRLQTSGGVAPDVKVATNGITVGGEVTSDVKVTIDQNKEQQTDGTYTITGTITVQYQPSANDKQEDIQVQLAVDYNAEARDNFTVHARSLPDEFVIVAKSGEKWYALNGDMSSSKTHPANGQVVVDDTDSPTKATYAPCNAIYTFDGMPNTGDRTYVRFQGTDGAWLWASTGDNTGIQNNTLAQNPAGDANPYNWKLTTTDNVTYQFSNANNNRNLRLNDEKFGMYTSGVQDIRILPVEAKCIYNYAPTNLKVSVLKGTYVTLTWDAVQGATKYQYSTDATNWMDAGVTPTLTINGLTETTAYTYYVRAYHEDADITQECIDYATVTFTTAACDDVPTNITYSADLNSITVSWTAAASNAIVKLYSDEEGTVEVKNSGSTTLNPYTFKELNKNTTYYLQVFAGGICASEIVEVSTQDVELNIVEWQPDGIVVDINTNEKVKVTLENEVSYGSGTGTVAEDLFFSKYFEGSGSLKMLAIYNGTGKDVDLSTYRIDRGSNGNATNIIITYDLSQLGTIKNGQEIVFYSWPLAENTQGNPEYSYECSKSYLNNVASKSGQEDNPRWILCGDDPTEKATPIYDDAMNFSGDDPLLLRKNEVLIDVIGVSTAADRPDSKSLCTGRSEEAWSADGVTNMDYGKTTEDFPNGEIPHGVNVDDETITAYTARVIMFRKNTVVSGKNAVTKNTTTFAAFAEEWEARQVCMSGDDGDLTCAAYQELGTFDYSEYYTKYESMDQDQEFDTNNRNADGTLTVPITELFKQSCRNIKITLKDAEDNVLKEQPYKVPIMITSDQTTAGDAFLALQENLATVEIDGSGNPTGNKTPLTLEEVKEICKTCDVVIRDNATLTKVEKDTPNDHPQVNNVYIYEGASLVVPDGNYTYNVNGLSLRRREDQVPSLSVQGGEELKVNAESIYLDVRVNAENWHWFTLPYDCDIADVTWVDGTPAEYGVDWFLSTYDGEKRAATQSGGCWAEFHGETIKAGVGYIVGIKGDITKPKYTFELRFPMSTEVLANELTDKTVPVNAWGVENDMLDNHRGWNLVGNPYLDFYKRNELNSFEGLRLGGKYILNDDNYWVDSGEWDGQPDGNLPYVVEPINGGWSAYNQVLVSSIDLLPFTAYFVQVGEKTKGHVNGEPKNVMFEGNNRGRASIVRRAPSSVSEQEEPVIVGVSLTNSKGESDITSLVIDDKYTDEYEMNADFFKWFGDYYRYYTRPVVYTIGADKQQRAFNAIDEEQAAKPVSMGTYTAQNGEYTFSLDRRSDLTRVKEVWLHDATESAYINLMQEDYSFSTGKTDGTGRFTLSVTLHPKSATDITDGMNGQVYVTSQQRMLYVNNLPQQARVWVYDAVGKLLVNESTNVYQRAYHVGQAGVYFVRVESQNGCETLQVVVE